MIIYGKQVCLYAMQRHPETVKTVYIAKKGVLPKPLFHQFHDKIKFLEEKWAQSMSKGGNHQGILLEVDDFKQSTLLNFSAIARTSSGALLDMPFVIEHNILDVFNELKQMGFIAYGAAMEGTPVQDMSFSHKRLLVLGSEGKGVSKKARSKLDMLVSIEMKHAFDSLNVSAAAAILIHRMGYAVDRRKS